MFRNLLAHRYFWEWLIASISFAKNVGLSIQTYNFCVELIVSIFFVKNVVLYYF